MGFSVISDDSLCFPSASEESDCEENASAVPVDEHSPAYSNESHPEVHAEYP